MAVARTRGFKTALATGNHTVDITSDAVGSLVVIWAVKRTNSLPTIPAGFTTEYSSDLVSPGCRVAWRKKQSGDTTFLVDMAAAQGEVVGEVFTGAAFGELIGAARIAASGNTLPFDALTVAATSYSLLFGAWLGGVATVTPPANYADLQDPNTQVWSGADSTLSAGSLDPANATISANRTSRLGVHVELLDATIRVTLTPATETDAAQAQTVRKRATLSPPTETDAPVGQTLRKRTVLGVATELDEALALSIEQSQPIEVTLTPALEADAAQALRFAKRLGLVPAAEADSGVAQTFTKRATLTPASEADAAVAPSVRKRLGLTAAIELDTALSVAIAQRIDLVPALEGDSAVALVLRKRLVLVPPGEIDLATAIALTTRLNLVPALELDQAVGISSADPIHVDLVPATETDAAVAAGIRKRLVLVPAAELDEALASQLRTVVRLTPALEVDEALAAIVELPEIPGVDVESGEEDLVDPMPDDDGPEPIGAYRVSVEMTTAESGVG